MGSNHGQEFGYKTMDKSTDATVLTNRSALTDKEEVQIPQVIVYTTTGYEAQRCQIHPIPISQRKLQFKGDTFRVKTFGDIAMEILRICYGELVPHLGT